MRIKIPPYPNYRILDSTFSRDVGQKIVEKSDSQGLSNELIMMMEFKPGEKRVFKVRPVRYKEMLFITVFPNPVHLFLSVAIEHYNNSEKIKETNFISCGKKYGDDVYLLDFQENETHDCYNSYIKYRASGIIMLVSSLEAFLNHIIPNDFVYHAIRNGERVMFNKDDIESSKVSFREKLSDVIPQWLNNVNFWQAGSTKEILLELYQNRKNIIHLKTNSKNDFDRYFPVIDEMLDLDISASIDAAIDFMNSISKNFIEVLDKK